MSFEVPALISVCRKTKLLEKREQFETNYPLELTGIKMGNVERGS